MQRQQFEEGFDQHGVDHGPGAQAVVKQTGPLATAKPF